MGKEQAAKVNLMNQVVVFVDFLGLKEKITTASSDEKQSTRLLHEFHDVLETAFEKLGKPDDWYRYRGFSDSFALSIPLWPEHETSMGDIVTTVSEFQLAMVLKGWFIRGGLAIGPFYQDDRIIFGPAFLEAYELESEKARDPRVVLSPRALEKWKSFLAYYGDPFCSPENAHVLVDTDGLGFVNYLYTPVAYDGTVEDMTETLRKHKARVEAALKASRGVPKVWSKYRWVAEYHDFYCRRFVKDCPEDLLVSPRSLRAEPSLLVARRKRKRVPAQHRLSRTKKQG